MGLTKARIAYLRKLYIAHLISSNEHNLVSLENKTGMHKRTIQTAMSGLADIGIIYRFIQQPGARNRHGYYEITDWGDHRSRWIKENLKHVVDVLQIDG